MNLKNKERLYLLRKVRADIQKKNTLKKLEMLYDLESKLKKEGKLKA